MTREEFENYYKNRTFIGSGGFAKVYKSFDHEKGYYVAIKSSEVRLEHKQFTLKREVEIVNALPPHPNVARYDACYRFEIPLMGEVDFAILEFFEDGNLEQVLNNHKPSPEEVISIVSGVLRGIGFLHQHNITHRDLKSQNILIKREGGIWSPKIADFGLARQMFDQAVTDTSVGISYAYAAPEQIRGQRISKMVDIWAVGIIIYRIVAGELPFRTPGKGTQTSQAQLELIRKITHLELPEKLNTLPEPYQSMIRRCLVLEPTERAVSAQELLLLMEKARKAPPIAVVGHEKTRLDEPAVSPILPEEVTVIDRSPSDIVPPFYGRNESAPPIVVPPLDEYHQPRPDYTQVLPPRPPEPPLSMPAVPMVKVGEPKRGFNWRWALALLLLAGLGYGAYRFIDQPTSPNEVEKVDFTVNGYISQDGVLDTFKVFAGDRVVFLNNSTPEKNVKTLVWSFVKDSVLISTAVNNNLVTVPFQEIGLFQIRLCVNGSINCVAKLMLVQERSSPNPQQITGIKPAIGRPSTPVYSPPQDSWTADNRVIVENEPPPALEPKTEADPVNNKQPEPVPPSPSLPSPPLPVQQNKKVPPIVEVMPDVEPNFPGGSSALSAYFAKNMKYPNSAREEDLEGNVVVQFDVNADGSVSNIKVIKKLGSGCDEEAVRLIKKMPKWTPGQRNGSNTKIRLSQSIRFNID